MQLPDISVLQKDKRWHISHSTRAKVVSSSSLLSDWACMLTDRLLIGRADILRIGQMPSATANVTMLGSFK